MYNQEKEEERSTREMAAMVGIPRDPYAIDTEFSENRTTKHVMGKIDAVRHMVGIQPGLGRG